MIPNCQGCKEELGMACEMQEMGYDVCLNHMGERQHVLVYVFDKNGKQIC